MKLIFAIVMTLSVSMIIKAAVSLICRAVGAPDETHVAFSHAAFCFTLGYMTREGIWFLTKK